MGPSLGQITAVVTHTPTNTGRNHRHSEQNTGNLTWCQAGEKLLASNLKMFCSGLRLTLIGDYKLRLVISQASTLGRTHGSGEFSHSSR